jgi:transposase
MDDATGLAEALLGLDGFGVLAVEETPSEVVVTVETVVDFVGCPTCGVRAEAKDRIRVDIRDLPCFGRPARLVWLKRRWRCVDADCAAKTWTEGTEHVAPRAVLTLRAGAEATRQVGELALPVAVVARELGVCWWTVMDAVVLHGTPLIDDDTREEGPGPRHRRDHVRVCDQRAPDDLRDRPGRPQPQEHDRHGGGKRCR